MPERREYEYLRHGSLCLTANFEVATGKVLAPTIAVKRDNEDFVSHIARTVAIAPGDSWVFVVDNLNTHTSEALVRYVAELSRFEGDLGRMYERGILRNQSTRANFLSDPSHRVRFVYTPKHCSWLNQVEIFFSVMARRLLRRGSFISLENLKERVLAFIEYYNEHWAKPYRWTHTGRPLDAKTASPPLRVGREGLVWELLQAKLRTLEVLH